MRAVITGAAVLCLVAAPAAQAAWQTSAPGTGTAEALLLASPAPITCTGRTVEWRAAGGPVQYRVWFNGGRNPDVTTSDTKTAAPGSGSVSVRVEAFAGTSWAVESSTAGKICS
jgi:hypothetical protein